jgi:transposase
MAEAYPIELRKRAVHAYESGDGTYLEVAAIFRVGVASLKRWVTLYRIAGNVTPQPKGGGRRSTITSEEIDAIVARLGDPTALEITAEFNLRRRGRGRVHVSSIKRALHRFGYVVKKNAAGRWRVCGLMSSRSERGS